MLSSILGFFGGLGIFLYGTNILSKALQKIGASKMRTFLATITDTRLKVVFSGIAVTFLLQSSTVTNIIVVGLVSETIITLAQAFGIVLGAAIGTTLTVQILTFDVSQYASIFIFIGAIFSIFVKHIYWRTIGNSLLSVGFILFGIYSLGEGINHQTRKARLATLFALLGGLSITGYTISDKFLLDHMDPIIIIQFQNFFHVIGFGWASIAANKIKQEW